MRLRFAVIGLLATQVVACDRSFHFSNAALRSNADAADGHSSADGSIGPRPEPGPADALLLADGPVVSVPEIDVAPLAADSPVMSVPEIDVAPSAVDGPLAPVPEPATPDASPAVDSFVAYFPDGAVPDLGRPETVDAGGADTSNLCGVAVSCPCVGTACTCGPLQSCDFSGVGCDTPGGSCSLKCSDGNICQGQCKDNCKLSCSGGSACTLGMGLNASAVCEGSGVFCVLTVGTGGTVECDDHSNCKVTCTGDCRLSCDDTTATSVCQLRCPGEGAYVAGSGTCPRGTSATATATSSPDD